MKKVEKSVFFAVLVTILFCWNSALPIQDNPPFKQPVLITSAGQSADVQLTAVLAKRAGLDFTLSKTATPAEMEGINTMILVLGSSLKGLGAAGLDVGAEKERVTSLIEFASGNSIPILALHLGGEQRRGTLSDQMITAFLPSAKSVIIVESGNKDGLFTEICSRLNIPLTLVGRAAEALEPIKQAFF